MSLRNVAIIAHVDHGKTTLVDEILKHCHVFRDNQVVRERLMDSNDLERERGITIVSKNLAVEWRDVRINLIDTPGHADFGGEVERVLKMADGVLLLVDAFEGPMPQTRFVLQKALQLHLKPIVVVNKMDRDNARPLEVVDEIFELFLELGADDRQLDFPVVFAAGRQGWAVRRLGDPRTGLDPLLDCIRDEIPAPEVVEGPLQLLITALDYSDYVGRIGIGRIFRGAVSNGETIALLKRDGSRQTRQIKQLLVFDNLGRREIPRAGCGEICALIGLEGVDIGDTVADLQEPEPLPIIAMDEPTLSMTFMVNTSPFYGQEGRLVTSRQVRERLRKETERDMALRVEDTAQVDSFKVSGRGILHLSILMETMRREGYEFMVGQPRVIYKEINGKKAEPVEVLTVDVSNAHVGQVIETVAQRRGEMLKMDPGELRTKLEFHMPSRGLIGFRSRMLRATGGEIVLYHRFLQYEFFKGSIPGRQSGSIVSMGEGEAVAYSLDALQDRGRFFVAPGDRVYMGQVIGEHCREDDIVVNVQKGKKLTNMRASGTDRAMRITPPLLMSLEECLEFLADDEFLEVTPESLRMRKSLLDENERRKALRLSLKAGEV
ncbi:MAG: translational GTPase TypA [bacterium]|jgi:GTP-binding protein|nr:translational GTPase TypA [bacterium]